MQQLTIEQKQQCLVVQGALTRRTLVKGFEKKSTSLLTHQIQLIDLAQVISADTAGLAWLLLMLEVADKQTISVKIINIPHELMKLAKLTAVDSFLPVE